ncbi:hypothetical protein, partial [Bacillus subtilis]
TRLIQNNEDGPFSLIFRQFLKNNRCVIHFRDIGSKQRGQGVGSVRRVAQYKTYGEFVDLWVTIVKK